MMQTATAPKIKMALSRYQEVYFTKDYLEWPKTSLAVRFHGLYYRFERLHEVWSSPKDEGRDQTCSVELKELESGEPDLLLTHRYNGKLKNDGFRLVVEKDFQVVIESETIRGFQYAMEALQGCFFTVDKQLFLPVLSLQHEPAIRYRGIIEGFYGTPWKDEKRLALFSYMKRNHLNTYMYAPKDDELLRKRWRELYEKAGLEKFQQILTEAAANQVDFWYMISPGNDIDVTNEEDIQTLLAKLDQLAAMGVSRFGLLLDDIDYQLKGEVSRHFCEPALAHAHLVQRVNAHLCERFADYELAVCPTEYDNRYGSRYLEVLSRQIEQTIPFFWTGPSTLASSITTKELQEMAEVYQRPMIVWDNIPVNDYLGDKELLFMSPYENRSPNIAEEKFQVMGVVANPMAQLEASKFTISSMAEYLWNCQRFDPYSTWQQVIKDNVDTELQAAFLTLTKAFPNHYTSTLISAEERLLLQDPSWVASEMKELMQTAETILKSESKRIGELKKELLSWLETIIDSWNFWQSWLVSEEKPADGKTWLSKKQPHRIGRDLVRAHLEYYLKQ